MSKQSLEKRLYVTNLKIDKTLKDRKFTWKEKIALGAALTVTTIRGPYFRSGYSSKTLLNSHKLSYLEGVFYCFSFSMFLLIFILSALRYQHHRKMKRLHKEKQRIEDLIDRYYTKQNVL